MNKAILLLSCVLSFGLGAGTMKLRRTLLENQAKSTPTPIAGNVPYDMSWWKFQVAHFKAIGTNKDIVMIGDSRVNMMEWGELLRQDNISNRGISSETIPYTLRRINESIPKHAKIVFIQIGINDV